MALKYSLAKLPARLPHLMLGALLLCLTTSYSVMLERLDASARRPNACREER